MPRPSFASIFSQKKTFFLFLCVTLVYFRRVLQFRLFLLEVCQVHQLVIKNIYCHSKWWHHKLNKDYGTWRGVFGQHRSQLVKMSIPVMLVVSLFKAKYKISEKLQVVWVELLHVVSTECMCKTLLCSWFIILTSSLAWENSRRFTRSPLEPSQNDVWVTNAVIPFWWRVTNQILVVLLIGWNEVPANFYQSEALPRSG